MTGSTCSATRAQQPTLRTQAIKTLAMVSSYRGIPVWTGIRILCLRDTEWSSVNRADQWGSCFGENNPFCDHAGLDGEGSFEADPAPIKAAIVDMSTSSQVYSWNEFTLRLEGLGARLQDPVVSEFESCACAVFYPELLGNKRPNRGRNSQ